MSPQELIAMCERQAEYGLSLIMLTIPEPKSGLRGRRVRTPFGLGEVVNVVNNRVTFWIEIKKVRAWIKKATAP